MIRNMGTVDRWIRVLVAIVLFYLAFIHFAGIAFGYTAMVVAIVLLLTGLTGYCPLYQLFHLRTNR